jgi:sortase B
MSKKRKRSAGHPTGTAPAQKQETVKTAGTEVLQQEVQETAEETKPVYSEDAYGASEKAESAQKATEDVKEAAPEEQEKQEAPAEEKDHAEHAHAEAVPEKKQQASAKKQPQKDPQPQDEEEDDDEDERPEQASKQSDKLFGTLIRKLIFSIALGVFCYALSGLLVLLWGYYSSQKEYRDLNAGTVVIGTAEAPENSGSNPDGIVVELPGGEQSETRAPYLDISVDEEKLKALNQDYAFYIVIPGTNIQYPVVQGEDNNHYLRYTYSNQENTAGSIALDYRTNRSTYLQTFNTIISGHNRQDGTMFSDLANYKEESFRDQHPYVYIIMDGNEYVYEVYSFYAMEPVAVCYNPNTADDVYLNFTKENNTYTNDIDVRLEDHIITMYTCNEDSSMRYLCHAILRDVYNLK